MTALLSLLLLAGPLAAQPELTGIPKAFGPDRTLLSKDLLAALSVVKRELEATPSGRQLYAFTHEVPIVERDAMAGPAVQYRGGEKPALLVDRHRAPKLSAFTFEALFVAARFKAAARLPLALFDTEFAAEQRVLRYALEKAAVRPEFRQSLRRAVRTIEKELGSRRDLRAWAKKGGGSGERIFPGRRPKPILARVAYDIYVFSEDPYAFYLAVRQSTRFAEETVGLTELSEFVERYAGTLARVQYRAGGAFAVVGDAVYPGRIARAAAQIKTRDGLDRLREGLGPFRSAGTEDLLPRVNKFIREAR
jgi:hypothetical protein